MFEQNDIFKSLPHDVLCEREKFEQHFPHIFSIHMKSDIDWDVEFRKTCDNEYKGLSEDTRKLFSLVKEGDIKGLEAISDLCLMRCLNESDKNGLSPLDWAKKKNNQALLDFLYQRTGKSGIRTS